MDLASMMKKFSPDPSKAGKTLLVLNALGMVFAAASNTFAAAVDKDTSAEDKKFLVPAGVVTGIANIGLYYAMTDKLIKKLKDSAQKVVDNITPSDLSKKAEDFALGQIKKAEKGGLFGFGKKSDEYVKAMKNTYFNDADALKGLKDTARTMYKNDVVAANGVLGAFIGAVVGCAILTPIIRDVSAYFVQKRMEKMNPDLKDQPYKPYLNPTRFDVNKFHAITRKQPLSMKNYMAFTSYNDMKI